MPDSKFMMNCFFGPTQILTSIYISADRLKNRLNLQSKVENALPAGYERNVFCAQNKEGETEATCRGDSGKSVNLCIL